VVCLAPRALEDSVRPRRLVGVVVGPSTSPLDGRIGSSLPGTSGSDIYRSTMLHRVAS